MRRPDVLVLSGPEDVTVKMVLDHLPPDVDVLWWDDHAYPAATELTTTLTPGGLRHVLRGPDGEFDLGDVRVGWLRRPHRPCADERVTEPSQRAFVESVSRYVLTGVWRSLAAEWLPAEPHAAAAADNKLTALTAAQAAGLDVPPTVVTNRPADLSRVWRDLDDDVVAKTPTFVAVTLDDRPRHLFTSRVTRRDLLRRRAVGYAPVILQRRIPKAVELRVTVVGQQCFAAEIHGQGSSRARQDWRRSYGHGLRYGVHQLPEHVEEGCRRVAAALGLSFGAIDLILTPDGRYVFLEINAGGQWGWIEDETGLPIAAAVADWILVRLEGKHG